jgi:ABC-type uncharacterized transport system substrate-binding protein
MKRSVISFIALALLGAVAFAHPHVGIEVELELVYAGKSCTGFWQEWTFDPVFSAMLKSDFDADRSGRFDEREQQAVHDGAFTNLRKYGYFTLVRRGARRTSPESIRDFSARVVSDRVVYRFFVPLSAQQGTGDFSLAVFDTTFYTNVEYKPEAVTLTQSAAESPKPAISRSANKNFPVYYNPADTASSTKTYSAWAPGLQTAYPDEIHIRWND